MVERGATETSALLGGPSYARGMERAGPSSAAFRDVEEGVAPDVVDEHDQHRRGRGLFARVVAGAALVVGCVALVGSGASRFHSTPMLGDASRHTERGDVAELSGNAPAGQQSKPRLLVAVISWQGGFEDTDAQERTWLPLLKDASPDIEVDYRVFIGRDFEKETDQETNAEAYRRRRMLRFDGEQTRRGPSVVTTGILPSNGDGGVGVDGVLGAGGAGGAGGSLSATAVAAPLGAAATACFSLESTLALLSVRWATKKAGGSSKNGRSSLPKMLGVKKFGGEHVTPGNIIIRQRGTKYRVGENVGLGRDHTLWALVEGHVKFSYDKFRKQNTVSVVPSLKHGDTCAHKALEARAHNHLDRAMGFLAQAKFAYSMAGEEGASRNDALKAAIAKVVAKAEKSQKLRLLGPIPKLEQ